MGVRKRVWEVVGVGKEWLDIWLVIFKGFIVGGEIGLKILDFKSGLARLWYGVRGPRAASVREVKVVDEARKREEKGGVEDREWPGFVKRECEVKESCEWDGFCGKAAKDFRRGE